MDKTVQTGTTGNAFLKMDAAYPPEDGDWKIVRNKRLTQIELNLTYLSDSDFEDSEN